MIWLPLIALATAAFLIAVFAARLPRSGWSLFSAALLVGLAGYALQGSPGMIGAPNRPNISADESNQALVDARRQMFNSRIAPSRFVTVADGFARRGHYEDAAIILSGAVSKNPKDPEAWLALANALVEHANGLLTPAALYAYERAQTELPQHPAPAYFLGVSLIRSGKLAEARQLWAATLEHAPTDAPWRPEMEERLARLDELLAQISGR